MPHTPLAIWYECMCVSKLQVNCKLPLGIHLAILLCFVSTNEQREKKIIFNLIFIFCYVQCSLITFPCTHNITYIRLCEPNEIEKEKTSNKSCKRKS